MTPEKHPARTTRIALGRERYALLTREGREWLLEIRRASDHTPISYIGSWGACSSQRDGDR